MRNAPTAIVDVYNANNTFANRMDFNGVDAEATARHYAEATGEVVMTGRSVILSDLYTESATHFSTFIPDGIQLGNDRLDAKDAKGYGGSANTLLIFIVRKPEAVKRSPLHSQALTVDELTFGLKVQQYHQGTPMGSVAVVVGTPQTKGSRLFRPGIPTVKVAVQQSLGEPVLAEWSLADAGVVPYDGYSGRSHWNETNYTLAV